MSNYVAAAVRRNFKSASGITASQHPTAAVWSYNRLDISAEQQRRNQQLFHNTPYVSPIGSSSTASSTGWWNRCGSVAGSAQSTAVAPVPDTASSLTSDPTAADTAGAASTA